MNRLKLTIALAAMAICTTTNAHASLIGDNVTLTILNNNVFVSSASNTVGNAQEFTSTQLSFFGANEFIDLTSNSINLSFLTGLQRTFTISGIDTPVTGVTSSSGTVSNLSSNSSSVSFLYTGAGATTGTVNLTFGSANDPQVPEPGTTALLVSGLAGILFYRRKR
jgi:hypothetical protein